MLLYIPFTSTLDPYSKHLIEIFFLSNNELKHLLKSKSKNARTLTRMLAGT